MTGRKLDPSAAGRGDALRLIVSSGFAPDSAAQAAYLVAAREALDMHLRGALLPGIRNPALRALMTLAPQPIDGAPSGGELLALEQAPGRQA